MPSRLAALALSRDLRFDLFAVVFALGTLHHELEFAFEQMAYGPLEDYMERVSRVLPSTGWPTAVGLGLHLGDVLLSLLIVFVPRRRELTCLLAPIFLASQLTSPVRVSSHAGMMAIGLV